MGSHLELMAWDVHQQRLRDAEHAQLIRRYVREAKLARARRHAIAGDAPRTSLAHQLGWWLAALTDLVLPYRVSADGKAW
jgi:hypothetical protein